MRDRVNTVIKYLSGLILALVITGYVVPPTIHIPIVKAGMQQTQITGNGPYVIMNFIEGSGAPSGTCNTSYNYGLYYWDHTNGNSWICAQNGWTNTGSGGGGGGGGTYVENDVAFSTTPTFSSNSNTINTITLTGNVVSSSLPAAASGGVCTTFVIRQGAGGPWQFAWPTNVHGGMNISTGYNSQSFCYYSPTNIWIANSPGVIGE